MKQNHNEPISFREWLWKKEKAKMIYLFITAFALTFGLPAAKDGEFIWVNLWHESYLFHGQKGQLIMSAISILLIMSNIILLYIADANYQSYCESFNRWKNDKKD